jgi:hypothetical protein
MKLLLIDSRVLDVTFVTSCITNDVKYVVFDYDNDTFETLVSKIGSSVRYERVGIFQENYDTAEYQLLSLSERSILFGVKHSDPTLESWKQYIQLIKNFRDNLSITNLDLMGCNIGSSEDWKYIETYLETNIGITINSSTDVTGHGGNWVLEEGNVDLVGTYFTSKISEYKGSLGSTAESSYMISTDNKLYGCGKYSLVVPIDTATSKFSQIVNINNVVKIS